MGHCRDDEPRGRRRGWTRTSGAGVRRRGYAVSHSGATRSSVRPGGHRHADSGRGLDAPRGGDRRIACRTLRADARLARRRASADRRADSVRRGRVRFSPAACRTPGAPGAIRIRAEAAAPGARAGGRGASPRSRRLRSAARRHTPPDRPDRAADERHTRRCLAAGPHPPAKRERFDELPPGDRHRSCCFSLFRPLTFSPARAGEALRTSP